MIVVSYTVDEAGGTPDDRVAVVRNRSEMIRESNFELFAELALEIVRDWNRDRNRSVVPV